MSELNNKSKQLFKRPSGPVAKKRGSKVKYKIITEEEYIASLSKIIQRDYFPDLAKLKVQNEYLDALASDDYGKLRQIYKKYQSHTPLSRRKLTNRPHVEPHAPLDHLKLELFSFLVKSPATFETPLIGAGLSETPQVPSEPGTSRSNRSSGSNSSTRSLSSGHSLDSFLDTYTSEDNQSFQEIIEAADQKLRQKYAVLFDAEESTKERLERALTLPGINEQFNADAPKMLDTWEYKNQNALMYNPDGVELTKAEQIEMAKQRQEIVRSNTRLKVSPFDEKQSKDTISVAAKAQVRFAGDRVGLDGRAVNGSDTPMVRGFSFVKTPSPMPGVDESPMMTWGEIEGTPFRLDGGDTPLRPSAGPSFRIAETPKRDAIALQLAGNNAEQQRVKKAKAIETAKRSIAASPRIRNSFQQLASMSPAAQRLARGQLATPSPRRTPGLTPLQKKTPLVSPLVRKKTPLVTRAQKLDVMETNLTDNLLSLPSNNKRMKATDFF